MRERDDVGWVAERVGERERRLRFEVFQGDGEEVCVREEKWKGRWRGSKNWKAMENTERERKKERERENGFGTWEFCGKDD